MLEDKIKFANLCKSLIEQTQEKMQRLPSPPIWANYENRKFQKYHLEKDYLDRYREKYVRYYTDIDEDVIEQASARQPKVLPRYARPTRELYTRAYTPALESQWFHPLINKLHVANRSHNSRPINLTELVGQMSPGEEVNYSSPEGKLAPETYKAVEIPWDANEPKQNTVDDDQNMNFYYVGLNEAQRATVLFAVNEVLIPFLNGSLDIPALRYFLPNLKGEFSSDIGEWKRNNALDTDMTHFEFNAKMHHKIQLLKYMLRTQVILPDYNKDLSNDELFELAEYYRAPQDTTYLPKWDEHIVPNSPASTFFERVMPDRTLRMARIFGRNALWDDEGFPRAGLMSEYDFLMMYLALSLVLDLHKVITGPNTELYKRSTGSELQQICGYFSGLGLIKKDPSYELDVETWTNNPFNTPTSYVPASLYDYSSKEVSDFVYSEIDDLYNTHSKHLFELLKEHVDALGTKLKDESGSDKILDTCIHNKQEAVVSLPFGYEMQYRNLIIMVDSLLNGMKEFLSNKEFVEYENVTELPWYKTRSLGEDTAGVFYGYPQIIDLIYRKPDDLLDGVEPRVALPVLEEDIKPTHKPVFDGEIIMTEFNSLEELEAYEQGLLVENPASGHNEIQSPTEELSSGFTEEELKVLSTYETM